MPEIEDQRMAERDRLAVIGLVRRQRGEERLIAVEGGNEVVADLAALGVGVGAVEQGRTGEAWCRHVMQPEKSH